METRKIIGYKYPKEIAESFEPIYEEVVFGGFEDIIKYFKGDMVHIGKQIAVESRILDEFIVVRRNKYQFTPEFEEKLKELGIEI